MRKLVLLVAGFIVIGFTATTVSAAEYEVKNGDSLWGIANDYGMNVEVLMNINNLHSTTIYPKQVLKLKEVHAAADVYKVQKGDTLSAISKKLGNGITVSDLKEWNHLTSDLIMEGQQLSVNGLRAAKTYENKTQPQVAAEIEVLNTSKENVTAVEEKEEIEEQPVEAEQSTKAENTEPAGTTLAVEATAYTAYCNGCSGVTATGVDLRANPNMKLIAVDPNIIPLGTKVHVEGYGYAVAGDTGGAIKGNKIDIHFPTKDEAYQWGRQTVKVTIVE